MIAADTSARHPIRSPLWNGLEALTSGSHYRLSVILRSAATKDLRLPFGQR